MDSFLYSFSLPASLTFYLVSFSFLISISFSEGLLVINSLSFCLLENVFILSSFLKDIFTGYRILGWQCSLPPTHWRYMSIVFWLLLLLRIFYQTKCFFFEGFFFVFVYLQFHHYVSCCGFIFIFWDKYKFISFISLGKFIVFISLNTSDPS